MGKPKLYITRQLPQAFIAPYEEQFTIDMWPKADEPVSQKELYAKATWADAILCLLTDQIDRAFLQHANHLKIIANMAVGYDNIDVDAANELNIIVTNTPDVLTETTADLTFALLMATARRLLTASRAIYENKWGVWSPFQFAGDDIHHKTIGIVGMGRIGAAVARRAKGFQMEILYHNRSRNERLEQELGAVYVSFAELLQRADYVVSMLPLTQETENMFDHDAFQQMKQSAIFINASRGGVVDETALYDALKNGVIKAAGLDVYKNEPIAADHPLTTLDNVVLLPHIGSATYETRAKMLRLCFENIVGVFYGNGPKTPVTNF